MPSDPKKKRIKLNAKDYSELRLRKYMQVHCCCEVCGCWMSYDEFSMHHIKSVGAGGDDVIENMLACHKLCHPD